MSHDFSVKEAVTARYSVRTYDPREVEGSILEKILAYADNLHNPLGPKIKVQLIKKDVAANGEKLGTYGVIQGAKLYLGVSVPDVEYAAEAVGYDFEQLVLYATSLGLGTCWLGGTFNRSAFSSAMNMEEGEIFPILSSIGYPATRKSFTEQMMRFTVKASSRASWNELFYQDTFTKPLTQETTGEYQFPLEMLRLAPSAINKQPWRVVMSDNKIHFYEKHAISSEVGKLDMHRIDVGIGICHFHLAALESGLTGHFERKDPGIPCSNDVEYIVSWVIE